MFIFEKFKRNNQTQQWNATTKQTTRCKYRGLALKCDPQKKFVDFGWVGGLIEDLAGSGRDQRDVPFYLTEY